MWETDLETAQSHALLPALRVSGYDVSRDGTRMAFAAVDEDGLSHVWLGRMAGRTPGYRNIFRVPVP